MRIEHPVAAAEIVASEADPGELLAGPGDRAHGDRAFGRPEVAVLPAGFGAEALTGAVAELAGDGARRRGLHVDGEVDAVAGRRTHLDLGGRDQPGGDQRPAQIVDLVALEAVTGTKAGDLGDVAGIERRAAGDPDRPERRHRPGRDGQLQRRQPGSVVDDDLLLADAGQGESAFAQRDLEIDVGGEHVLGDDGVAWLDRERLAQPRRLGAGGVEPGKLDRLEAILLARLGFEGHLQRLPPRLDQRIDLGIVKALRAKQLGENFGIGFGTALDLGGVGRLPAPFVERRLGLERRHQLGRVAEPVEPVDRDRVVPLGTSVEYRLIGQRRVHRQRLGRLLAKVGPVDADVGHGVERCGRIERRRRRLLGGGRRRAQRGARGRAQQPRGHPR